MSNEDSICSRGKFPIRKITRFYVPLLVQAFSQSLTYPLVAGIVTHGQFGKDGLTAFSQGQIVMFMIGALGIGLIPTGMMFVKTRKGYDEYCRLNTFMMTSLIGLQCLAALPPFYHWIFEGVLALPRELAELARWTLLGGAIMNGLFFMRNVPMVVLFNNYQSGKANLGTIVRILLTAILSFGLQRLKCVGAYWGLLALTAGVAVEYLVTWAYARPYVKLIPGSSTGEHVSLWEQLKFTLPLSFGGFLLMVAPLCVSAFVGRATHPDDMLSIHYVTIGVANPIAYAALRMQTVAIKFPPAYPGDRRLLVYALAAGAILGLMPLVFAHPTIGNWYFGTYQNLPERLLPTARLAIGIYAFIAMIHAVRGRIEGLAALRKRPVAVMAGQIGYTAALAATLAVLLFFKTPGWIMALSAIFVAPAFATVCIYLTLYATDSFARKKSA